MWIWAPYLSQSVWGWCSLQKTWREDRSLAVLPPGCRWSFSSASISLMFLKRPLLCSSSGLCCILNESLSLLIPSSSSSPSGMTSVYVLHILHLAARRNFKIWAAPTNQVLSSVMSLVCLSEIPPHTKNVGSYGWKNFEPDIISSLTAGQMKSDPL